MTTKRCMILGCTDLKVRTDVEIPALELYDGPIFRTLRSNLRVISDPIPEIYILSTQYGLIDQDKMILGYNTRMTTTRANELNSWVMDNLMELLSEDFNSILVTMGRKYLKAMSGFEDLVPPETTIHVSKLPMGMKLGEMLSWFWAPHKWPQVVFSPNDPLTEVQNIQLGDYLMVGAVQEQQVIKDPKIEGGHVWLETESVISGYPKNGYMNIEAGDLSQPLRKDRSVIHKSVNPKGELRKDVTVEEAKRLEALGWSAGKIARHFNCGYRTIRRRLGRE